MYLNAGITKSMFSKRPVLKTSRFIHRQMSLGTVLLVKLTARQVTFEKACLRKPVSTNHIVYTITRRIKTMQLRISTFEKPIQPIERICKTCLQHPVPAQGAVRSTR